MYALSHRVAYNPRQQDANFFPSMENFCVMFRYCIIFLVKEKPPYTSTLLFETNQKVWIDFDIKYIAPNLSSQVLYQMIPFG